MSDNFYEFRDTAEIALQNVRTNIPIDQHDLDTELVNQAEWYHVVAEISAKATSWRDFYKDQLKQRHASEYLRLRKEAAQSKERITEAMLEASVLDSSAYQDAAERYDEAVEIYNMASALKDTLDQRKSMLRDLVQLFISDYYSKRTEFGAGPQKQNKDLQEAADMVKRIVAERKRSEREATS